MDLSACHITRQEALLNFYGQAYTQVVFAFEAQLKEKGTTKSEAQKQAASQRKRGQQPTNSGPARRDYSHLPATEETIDLARLFHEESTAAFASQAWTALQKKKWIRRMYNTPSSIFSSAPCPA